MLFPYHTSSTDISLAAHCTLKYMHHYLVCVLLVSVIPDLLSTGRLGKHEQDAFAKRSTILLRKENDKLLSLEQAIEVGAEYSSTSLPHSS